MKQTAIKLFDYVTTEDSGFCHIFDGGGGKQKTSNSHTADYRQKHATARN